MTVFSLKDNNLSLASAQCTDRVVDQAQCNAASELWLRDALQGIESSIAKPQQLKSAADPGVQCANPNVAQSPAWTIYPDTRSIKVFHRQQ